MKIYSPFGNGLGDQLLKNNLLITFSLPIYVIAKAISNQSHPETLVNTPNFPSEIEDKYIWITKIDIK